MTLIQKLIADVLKKEGGYVNHPADKGGATNYGITKATLSNYLGKSCTPDDVKAMTKATAADIYEHRYFIDTGIQNLPEEIIPMLFDMAVNHGSSNAVKMLQLELAEFGDNSGAGEADGIIGKRTIEAAKHAIAVNKKLFNNELVARRLNFYRDIVRRNPSQKVFLNGWETRAKSFLI
jgi:lysozyme family protein